AEATGPAARPLPLFYALSQGGRAIIAARGGQLARNHGLSVPDPPDDLLAAEVLPERTGGWFQTVSEALESPGLSSPVQLGALVASLPETDDDLLPGTRWPRPIAVWPNDGALAHIRDRDRVRVRLML